MKKHFLGHLLNDIVHTCVNIFVDHMSEDVRLEARAEAERLTRLIIRHARMSRSRKTSTPFTYNL